MTEPTQTKVPVPRQSRTTYPGFACAKCHTEMVATDLSFDPRFGWGPCPTCKRRTVVRRIT